MLRAIRRLNQWQAALLLAAAALALAVSPLHSSKAQEPAGPAPPTGVSATDITVTATEARATLTWNPVGNAASYGVWRNDAAPVYTTDTRYTFTGLYPHRTYSLTVWTRTADGATGPGAGVQVTMPARPGVPQTAAPTNMALSDVTSSSVTVSWSAVAGATAYQIARSGVGRTTLAGAARSHTLTDLTAGQGYSVWLWAIGHGGVSNNVRRVFTTLPAAPTGLDAPRDGARTGAPLDPSAQYVQVFAGDRWIFYNCTGRDTDGDGSGDQFFTDANGNPLPNAAGVNNACVEQGWSSQPLPDGTDADR